MYIPAAAHPARCVLRSYLQQVSLVCPHPYAAIYGPREQQLRVGGIGQACDHAPVHSLGAQQLPCLQIPYLQQPPPGQLLLLLLRMQPYLLLVVVLLLSPCTVMTYSVAGGSAAAGCIRAHMRLP